MLLSSCLKLLEINEIMGQKVLFIELIKEEEAICMQRF